MLLQCVVLAGATTTKHTNTPTRLVELNPRPLCHHSTESNSVMFRWPRSYMGVCLCAHPMHCPVNWQQLMERHFRCEVQPESLKSESLWHIRITCQAAQSDSGGAVWAVRVQLWIIDARLTHFQILPLCKAEWLRGPTPWKPCCFWKDITKSRGNMACRKALL